MILLFGIQILIAAYLFFVICSYLRYHREQMPRLSSVGFKKSDAGVLVIVPCKDEEEGVTPCLERLMQLQGLPNLKVMAVDDRSTDRTREKIRAVASRFPDRIELVCIEELPDGWLGKNHACWIGAQRGMAAHPNTQFLVFTDGDVKMHPQTIAESVNWMSLKQLDFMTAIEDSEFEGIVEPAYLLLFGILLIFFSARPWLLFKKKGRNFMGNGAYIVTRREAYEATAAHKTLRLEVVEDMRMGLLMRSQGFRCGTVVGLDRVQRRWLPGFTGIFKGLLKNAFAGFEYNLLQTLGGILFFPLTFLVPWVLLFTGHWLIGGINFILLAIAFWLGSQNSRLPWLTSFLLSPFLSLAASANLATSAAKVLMEGGVSWRGTRYPISDLKAHCLTVRRAYSGKVL